MPRACAIVVESSAQYMCAIECVKRLGNGFDLEYEMVSTFV